MYITPPRLSSFRQASRMITPAQFWTSVDRRESLMMAERELDVLSVNRSAMENTVLCSVADGEHDSVRLAYNFSSFAVAVALSSSSSNHFEESKEDDDDDE
ncbi:unnamed protein product [Tilletia caries]|nr:unnamed protein product [Tilletia caries]